jgi:hypothetical protein
MLVAALVPVLALVGLGDGDRHDNRAARGDGSVGVHPENRIWTSVVDDVTTAHGESESNESATHLAVGTPDVARLGERDACRSR